MGTVVKTLRDIQNYVPTKEEIDAYEEYKKRKHKKENLSDMPELTSEQLTLAIKARQIRQTLYKW